MPEAALAIFGGWVLASMVAGLLFASVRSWLENRRKRSGASQEAQVQIARRGPAATTGELKLVGGDEKTTRPSLNISA